MPSSLTSAVAAAAAAALVAAVPSAFVASADAAAVTRGDGIGDPYYPHAGNPGYNVRHYGIDVRYRPQIGRLTGTTTIRLAPKKRLQQFNLDLVLDADRVQVNGTRARFSQTKHELTVRPAKVLRPGHLARVRVSYHGKPAHVRYAGETPFERTRTGALAVGEPNIAAWWFPSNDHPSDRATFDIRLVVPKGFEGVSNGALVGRRHTAKTSVWRWSVGSPMATYLAFAAMGQYDVQRGTAAGRPYLYAFERGLGRADRPARYSVHKTPEIVRWLAKTWGAYPFRQIGGVVANLQLGYALENQTRPVYGRDMFGYGSDVSLIVHEMAHQWFGDAVAVRRWKHIWLNEGYATYAEWLWSAHRGDRGPQRRFMSTYNSFEPGSSFWNLHVGDPGRSRLFDWAVYERGAMTLQALRNRVGSRDFFAISRQWVHHNRDGLGGTPEYKRVAERVSGENLDRFFKNWLFSSDKPRRTHINGF